MPTDSNAVTPSSSSVSGSPKMSVPPTSSPINSISAVVISTLTSVPSAGLELRCAFGLRLIASRCCRGTRESMAPVSPRNSPSQALSGAAGFLLVTVTCVTPVRISSSLSFCSPFTRLSASPFFLSPRLFHLTPPILRRLLDLTTPEQHR